MFQPGGEAHVACKQGKACIRVPLGTCFSSNAPNYYNTSLTQRKNKQQALKVMLK
jgi:hypothetical protein